MNNWKKKLAYWTKLKLINSVIVEAKKALQRNKQFWCRLQQTFRLSEINLIKTNEMIFSENFQQPSITTPVTNRISFFQHSLFKTYITKTSHTRDLYVHWALICTQSHCRPHKVGIDDHFAKHVHNATNRTYSSLTLCQIFFNERISLLITIILSLNFSFFAGNSTLSPKSFLKRLANSSMVM